MNVLDPVTQHHVRQAAEALATEFEGVFSQETIERYIAEFCRVIRPGGLVMFQLPSHIPAIYRTQWRRRLYAVLRRLGVGAPFLYRRLRLIPIAMSYIPEPEILQQIESVGARVLEVDSVVGEAGVRSSTYYVTR